jgi:FtsP/CotA-like multicopper oxidase with cupredoxin domain
MRILKFRWSRRTKTAWKNRQEIVRAGLTRRDLLKYGLITTAGVLIPREGLSQWGGGGGGNPTSPPTTPWMEALPIPPVKQPVASLSPAPQVNPLPGEGRTRAHQALTQFPPARLYEVRQREAMHTFHPQLPAQAVWGYDGITPGPTYVARYGQPILVRNFNELPQDHAGFGIPQVSTHLHNGHTPSESDGFPCDFFPFAVGGPQRFYDHHYPNVYAGFTDPAFGSSGDPREAMSTLWYHDHRVDFTAPNVYKGLAGFYLLYNDRDTGDEQTGFRLPSGPYDVPIIFNDKLFDENGQLFFELFTLDGILGDKFMANGKIQPYFRVAPRRYRFRWLNGGPSRFYQMHLTNLQNLSQIINFTHIASDGNLLPASYSTNFVVVSVAERVDVIVDFAPFAGKSIYLENRMEQTNGQGPTGNTKSAGQGNLLVRFDVNLPAVADASAAPPYTFYSLPAPSATELSGATQRSWRFERSNGQWTINGRFFDCDTVQATIPRGSREQWTLEGGRGWQHPIHIHFEEFQIQSRSGSSWGGGSWGGGGGTTSLPAGERGRKDVVRLRESETIRIFMRFRDFVGKYVMHCHNTIHEDHAMMLRWDIV